MKLNTYLHYNGNCEEAFKFYEKAVDGKIVMKQTYGDSPAAGQSPDGVKDRIIHARIQIGDTVVMGSDAPPDHFAPPQGFSMSLSVPSLTLSELTAPV